MINEVILVGRLTDDPELRKTKTNKSVLFFSLALNKYVNKEKRTAYARCKVWDQGAEYLAQYAKKGNIVGVTGEIANNEYTDKDGKKIKEMEILANRVQLLSMNEKKEIKETKIEEPSFFNRKDMDVSSEFKVPEWGELPWDK